MLNQKAVICRKRWHPCCRLRHQLCLNALSPIGIAYVLDKPSPNFFPSTALISVKQIVLPFGRSTDWCEPTYYLASVLVIDGASQEAATPCGQPGPVCAASLEGNKTFFPDPKNTNSQ